MPSYQIHRMKESQRQQFRWAPHTSGEATVKPKDYELAGVVEAETVYAAWEQLRKSDSPLQVGDLLEEVVAVAGGPLRICKYVGIEEARWWTPEPTPSQQPEPSGPGQISVEL